MAYFVIEYPLKTEKYQEDIIEKRLEIARKIYNTVAHVTWNRYNEMKKTRRYRDAMATYASNQEKILEFLGEKSKESKEQIKKVKEQNKEQLKILNDLRTEYKISKFAFSSDITKAYKHFNDNIDSATAQRLGDNLWRAYEKIIFSNGNKLHFKRYGEMNAIAGKTNASGIRVLGDVLKWNGLQIPIMYKRNQYEEMARENTIICNTIVRKVVNNKKKYYVHVTYKGEPPVKFDIETGEIKHSIGTGKVGLYIGTSHIAICKSDKVEIIEIADRTQNIQDEITELQRKMDRSMRAMNPDNYNSDGTIKKQGNKKVVWVKSKKYLQYQDMLKSLNRKQADTRKLQHECLANYIISQGDSFFINTISFKALQMREEKERNGEKIKKKRYGRVIANRAPSMLIDIINRKLARFNKELNVVDTGKEKRTLQFNHVTGLFSEDKQKDYYINIGQAQVHRLAYGAFLNFHATEDLNGYDIESCRADFEDFLRLKTNIDVVYMS